MTTRLIRITMEQVMHPPMTGTATARIVDRAQPVAPQRQSPGRSDFRFFLAHPTRLTFFLSLRRLASSSTVWIDPLLFSDV